MKVLLPHYSCIIQQPLTKDEPDELPQAIAEGYTEIYISTPYGFFKRHKLRGENRYVQVKVETVPGYEAPEKMKQQLQFLPAGKVPSELLVSVEAFFRKIMQIKKSDVEAMIWIMYNEERGYYLHVPDQEVSKASVKYNWDIPEGSSIIVDIHSHNTMGAFFSSTDDNDDKTGVRFSGVFGQLQNVVPQTTWRFNYGVKKFEVKLTDIFNVAPSVDIPEEWLNNVREPAAFQYQGSPLGYTQGWRNSRPLTPGGIAGFDNKSTTRPGNAKRDRDRDRERFQSGKGQGGFVDESDAQFETYGKGGSPKKADGAVNSTAPGFYELSEEAADRAISNLIKGTTPEDDGDYVLSGWEDMVGGVSDSDLDPVSNREGDEVNMTPTIHTDLLKTIAVALNNSEYDALAINHGVKATNAFVVMNELMADLDTNPELMMRLMEDMTNLLPPQTQSSAVRRVFEQCSGMAKRDIEENGI